MLALAEPLRSEEIESEPQRESFQEITQCSTDRYSLKTGPKLELLLARDGLEKIGEGGMSSIATISVLFWCCP